MTALNEISNRQSLALDAIAAMPVADLIPLLSFRQSGGVEDMNLSPNLCSTLTLRVLLRSRTFCPRDNRLRSLSLSNRGQDAKQYLSKRFKMFLCNAYGLLSFKANISGNLCMCYSELEQSVLEMTPENTTRYVKKLVKAEQAAKWGDLTPAIERVGRALNVSFWTVKRLHGGKMKSVDVGLFARIRRAYIELCERQIAALSHELKIETELFGNADFHDYQREVEVLSAKISKAKHARHLKETRS